MGGRALSAASVLVPIGRAWSEVSSARLRLFTFHVGVLAVRCWETDVRLKDHFLLLALLGETIGSMKVGRMRWRLVSRSSTRGGGGEEEEAAMRCTSSMQEMNATQSSTVQKVEVCMPAGCFRGWAGTGFGRPPFQRLSAPRQIRNLGFYYTAAVW